MSNLLRAFLARALVVQTADPDIQRKGRLLNILLLIDVSLVLLLTAINLYELSHHQSGGLQSEVVSDLLLDIFTVLLMLGLAALNRKGHTRLAAVSFLMAGVGGCTLFFKTDSLDRVLLVYTVPILASSFIMSPGSSFVFAALSSLGYSMLYLGDPGSRGYNYISVLGLFMMAALAWLAATGVETALRDARQSLTRELAVQNRLRAEIAERQQVEAALRASEERLLMVMAAAPLFLFATDAAGVLTLLKGRGLDAIMRGDPTRLIGYSVFDPRHAIPHSIQADIRRALAGETFTNTIETKGLAFEMWYSVHRDSLGRVTDVIGVATNITERKALEDMWKRYAFIANTSREFMTLMDRRRTYVAVNEAYCKAHNKARAEILGKTAAEVWGEVRYAAHIQASLDQCFTGREVHYQAWFEFAAQGPRFLDVAYYPYFENGVVTHVVVVSHDDTEHRQAAEALDRERRLLRTVIDNVPDQIFARDTDCRFILNNRSDAQAMGVSDPDLLLGKSDYDFCPAELAAHYQADNRQVMTTGHPLINREEPLLALANGAKRWGLTTKVPLRDSTGQVIGVVGIARDITDRKHMEETLRASEERYRALVETSPDAITLTDLSGRFVMANRRAAEMHRFDSAEEMIGTAAFDLIAPEDRPNAQAAIMKALGTGQARNVEYTMLRTDGSRFPAELSGSAVTDAAGRPLALMGVTRDITERKQAEKALQAAHAQNQLLLTSITSILIGVGPDDRVTHWNAPAETAFGIAAAQAIGRPFTACDIPWDGAEIARRVATIRADNRPVYLSSIRYTRLDGKDGFLNTILSPFVGDEPDQAGFLLLAEDITERKILEMQLVQAQKLEAIGQLAAGIAHEINTPIQYVGDNTRFLQESFFDIVALLDKYQGLVQAARAGSLDCEQVIEIDRAETEIDLGYLTQEIPKAIYESLGGIARVAEIVRAMREFSHPDIGEKVATNLNKAIENTITVARNEWKYVAEVQTDLAADLPRVPCLPGEFNQVILNLLVNAAQSIADVVGDGSHGKGTITVTTRRVGDRAEICVRDTGTGIPEAVRGRIFDPFFTTKEVGKGTGQGLAISYNVIVEKHGGTITFETELGQGTTFIIRLPIVGDLTERDRDNVRAEAIYAG